MKKTQTRQTLNQMTPLRRTLKQRTSLRLNNSIKPQMKIQRKRPQKKSLSSPKMEPPTPQTPGRLSKENIMHTTPGPTRFACPHAEDILSAFALFMHDEIRKIITEMTNAEGRRVYGDSWKETDWVELQGYIGLLILSGVYWSHTEATTGLWHAETGRPIFRVSLKCFQVLTRVIRFDDKNTRADRREHDKLAAIREVWDLWVHRLPQLYNPGPDVTADECLVPFKQYLPTKLGKYGIKIWAACDSKTSYVWKL